ncbi:tRNA N6-adenosine threonylcarbamoyltransferase, mitochondrial isoform X3 [Nycticebus coucang]|uniref:tRNA N6-adenosine threonylcarbamoyltransferase, mitochondrial isoform X3 n=1 Tax=Nycticebus coucang TaxID=9470 RepID=UPI00234CFEC4|nr:tRNA N6-adenosine threonylcarbamoyltransferase, mitochondrial isoform X3 [Nycticebus coucang]
MLILNKTVGVFSKQSKRNVYEFLRSFNIYPGPPFLHKLVLGIETSCDDTAAAVVDETGNVLGEAIHHQTEVHLKGREFHMVLPQARVPWCQLSSQKPQVILLSQPLKWLGLQASATMHRTGGIIPPVAQQLHRENIQRIVQEALSASRISPSELSAIATTIKPGLALSLGVARRLSLIKHPECTTMSGGKAIEHLAKQGNRFHFDIQPPMQRAKNCDFSFSGLQHVINKIITQKEKEEDIEKGQILSSASDIAAAVQHATACHIAKRTHRAILFCKQRELLSQSNAVLVVSGGVASNSYIRKALEIVTSETQCTLLCPPPRLCTDNGVMIAWNGIERLRAGLGILHNTEGIRYEPKCPLGVDISKEVGEAAIKVPRLKMKI